MAASHHDTTLATGPTPRTTSADSATASIWPPLPTAVTSLDVHGNTISQIEQCCDEH